MVMESLQDTSLSGLDPILYRGTGHDEDGVYSEEPEVYQEPWRDEEED